MIHSPERVVLSPWDSSQGDSKMGSPGVQELRGVVRKENIKPRIKGRDDGIREGEDNGKAWEVVGQIPLQDCTNLGDRLAPGNGQSGNKGQWKRPARMVGQKAFKCAQNESKVLNLDSKKRERQDHKGALDTLLVRQPGKKCKPCSQPVAMDISKVVETSRDWSLVDQ